MKTRCFIGHRKINKTVGLCERISKTILDLILNKEVEKSTYLTVRLQVEQKGLLNLPSITKKQL